MIWTFKTQTTTALIRLYTIKQAISSEKICKQKIGAIYSLL